jgi:hypothetical protein
MRNANNTVAEQRKQFFTVWIIASEQTTSRVPVRLRIWDLLWAIALFSSRIVRNQTAPTSVIQQTTMAGRKEAFSSSGWPNMLEEGMDMLQGSILIYAFADIRQLARKGMLAGDAEAIEKITATPIIADDMIHVVTKNADTLRTAFGEESVSIYLSSLEHIRESIRRQSVSPDGKAVSVSAKVEVFDDENSDSELVYGIFVNSASKRITVAFRGSVTATDFVADANSYMKNIPNPVASERGQRKNLGIHDGFYGKTRIYSRLRRLST